MEKSPIIFREPWSQSYYRYDWVNGIQDNYLLNGNYVTLFDKQKILIEKYQKLNTFQKLKQGLTITGARQSGSTTALLLLALHCCLCFDKVKILYTTLNPHMVQGVFQVYLKLLEDNPKFYLHSRKPQKTSKIIHQWNNMSSFEMVSMSQLLTNLPPRDYNLILWDIPPINLNDKNEFSQLYNTLMQKEIGIFFEPKDEMLIRYFDVMQILHQEQKITKEISMVAYRNMVNQYNNISFGGKRTQAVRLEQDLFTAIRNTFTEEAACAIISMID